MIWWWEIFILYFFFILFLFPFFLFNENPLFCSISRTCTPTKISSYYHHQSVDILRTTEIWILLFFYVLCKISIFVCWTKINLNNVLWFSTPLLLFFLRYTFCSYSFSSTKHIHNRLQKLHGWNIYDTQKIRRKKYSNKSMKTTTKKCCEKYFRDTSKKAESSLTIHLNMKLNNKSSGNSNMYSSESKKK